MITADLLNNCEREPLANSGHIQPHGALLFLERNSGLFTYASENCSHYLGEPLDVLLGSDGRAWLAEMLPDLTVLPDNAGDRRYLQGALDLGGGELDVVVSSTAQGWLLEFERVESGLVAASSALVLADANPIAGGDQQDIAAACQAVVDSVSALTGYDRVMLYQFLPDWSGEVLAERVLRSGGTYLGLRFPASDIPAIARALYAQLPYRYIPLASNDSVAVYCRAGAGESLDLSCSDLRSVSPVHIQYLGNMQVQGSFSLSIMLDGKLWGLVACHNEGPGPIPLSVRLACVEQVAKLVTALSARRLAQHKHIADTLAASVVGGLAAASSTSALAEALCSSLAALQGLLDFGGGVVDVGGETRCFGVGPHPDLARALMATSMNTAFDAVAMCESLPQDFGARADCQAAGAFGFACIHLRAPHLGNTLVSLGLLRPEEAGEVAWAGNPEKPVELNAGGAVQLSPRKSFEKWMQVREGMCRVWTEDDRFTLGLLRRQLDAALS